jgi:hypothetical protein
MCSDLAIARRLAQEREPLARNKDCDSQGNEIDFSGTSDSWKGCDSSDSDGGALL